MSYNGSGQGVSWYLLLANVQRGSGELSSPLSDGALVSTAHQYQTGLWRAQLTNVGRIWQKLTRLWENEDCSGGGAAAGPAALSRCKLLSNTCRRQGLRSLEAWRGGDTELLETIALLCCCTLV